MGQAKRKGTLEQRQHRATQRQWLEDIKRSHLIIQQAKRLEKRYRFLEEIKRGHEKVINIIECPRQQPSPRRSISMSKIKNFKPNNHRR